MTTAPPSRQLETPTWRLVTGLLGGAISWAVSFALIYFITEAACEFNVWQSDLLGLTILAWVILLITAVATAVALYAAYWGWQAMRREQERGYQVAAETAFDRALFMGYGGLFLNGLFTFIILFIGLPASFLTPCGWG